jgi:hypothetical protein
LLLRQALVYSHFRIALHLKQAVDFNRVPQALVARFHLLHLLNHKYFRLAVVEPELIRVTKVFMLMNAILTSAFGAALVPAADLQFNVRRLFRAHLLRENALPQLIDVTEANLLIPLTRISGPAKVSMVVPLLSAPLFPGRYFPELQVSAEQNRLTLANPAM